MKLLFIGSQVNLNLDKIGGIESTMFELIKYLIATKHDVKIILIDDSLQINSKFEFKNLDLPVFKMNLREARKEILKQYDVINFLQTPFENVFFTAYFLILRALGRVYSVKFYFTYSTLINSNYLQKIKLKLLINQTIVFSKRLEERALNYTKNVTYLSPPVADYYFQQSEHKNDQKIKLLFAGRLSKDKGIEIVIEVFKKLPRDKYSLNVIGYFSCKADEAKYRIQLLELELDNFTVVNHSSEKIENQYLPLKEYDILLLPYQDLGPTLDTPLIILEGLVSNCKIVTSNIGSLSSISGNISFLEQKASPNEFQKEIEKIQLRAISQLTTDYSTEFFANQYLKIVKR